MQQSRFRKELGSLCIALTFVVCVFMLGNLSNTRVFGQAGPSGTIVSLQPNARFASAVFTATAQSKVYPLSGWSMATISFNATALTTASFSIQGSNDGGVTYYQLITSPNTATTNLLTLISPGTVTITTAPTLELINVAGFTNLKLATTGTFTATNVTASVTATSNVGLF